MPKTRLAWTDRMDSWLCATAKSLKHDYADFTPHDTIKTEKLLSSTYKQFYQNYMYKLIRMAKHTMRQYYYMQDVDLQLIIILLCLFNGHFPGDKCSCWVLLILSPALLLLLLLLLLQPFNSLFSRTTWVSRYQKRKTSLDLIDARDDRVWGCSGISWTICEQSVPWSRQITTPTPHYSIFTGRMLFLTCNQQCQSTEGTSASPIIEEKLLGIIGMRVFTDWMTYHPYISVKVLKETQSTNPNQWPGIILSASNIRADKKTCS